MIEFSRFNPFVILIYFVIVIALTMFFNNPILILLSFVVSTTTIILVQGFSKFKESLGFYLLLFILIVVINPIFVHRGATNLFFINGNAVTLEAVAYGFVFAFILTSSIFWFNSFNKLMTSDKIIYLFSRFVPTIGLVISMILRFIPRFQKQLKDIVAFSSLNEDPAKSKKISSKAKSVFKTFSILLTWSFENSIDVADTMRARGYGLKNRTSFHLFKFERRDKLLILILIVLLIINLINYQYLDFYFYYYPEIAPIKFDLLTIYGYSCYLLLLLVPIIFEVREGLKWRLLISKI